jgi:hypothetical protein
MALAADTVLDAALNVLKNNVTAMHLTDGFDPGSHNRAWVLSNSLGNVDVDSGDWVGPADGPVDGRRVTLNALLGIATANLGAAAGDLVIVLISASEVLYSVDETSEREIVNGETLPFPAIPITIRDPA